MPKQTIVIEFDDTCTDEDGAPLDLACYLQNEFANHDINATIKTLPALASVDPSAVLYDVYAHVCVNVARDAAGALSVCGWSIDNDAMPYGWDCVYDQTFGTWRHPTIDDPAKVEVSSAYDLASDFISGYLPPDVQS